MYKLVAASSSVIWLPYVAFVIAAFSALRLAIFNVDESQTDSFKGLNTPANTLFITSLPLLSGTVAGWLHQDWLLVLITIVFSLLMVSPIKFFAFKFKNFTWADNRSRFSFIGLSAVLLIVFQVAAIPLIILLYIFTSLIGGGLRFEKQ
jgi:CDP-diacylglycerol--serine O-phosphatidyltransferase